MLRSDKRNIVLHEKYDNILKSIADQRTSFDNCEKSSRRVLCVCVDGNGTRGKEKGKVDIV
jgi:hypothetical protein